MAAGGFAVAYYIWRHKKRGAKLICPLGADCEAVIHSQYANWFGVPNEVLGMIYYAVIFLGYGAALFFPALFEPLIITIGLTVASGAAAAMGVFLLYLQAVQIKEWCSWCIISSLLSFLIFLSVLGTWTV